MTQYERSGQPWRDDPAQEVVDAMYRELSEDLGTADPAETFGHPDDLVGHLVEDDEGAHEDVTSEAVAYDTHDQEDLAAEELAMHFVDLDAPEDDLSVPEISA